MPTVTPTAAPGHPQAGIFALGARAHHHLQFDVEQDPAALRRAIAELRQAANAVRGVNVVAGFGARLWAALAPGAVPDDLVDFSPSPAPRASPSRPTSTTCGCGCTPPDSHVSRVVIEDDAGQELQVFRRSSAFGGVRGHGLQFVAFAADRARLLRMLERIAGVGDGRRGRLTHFSTPTALAWCLAPPVELLRADR